MIMLLSVLDPLALSRTIAIMERHNATALQSDPNLVLVPLCGDTPM